MSFWLFCFFGTLLTIETIVGVDLYLRGECQRFIVLLVAGLAALFWLGAYLQPS